MSSCQRRLVVHWPQFDQQTHAWCLTQEFVCVARGEPHIQSEELWLDELERGGLSWIVVVVGKALLYEGLLILRMQQIA